MTDAKYVTTVSSCHWIRGRSVTVIALLAYAIRNAQITRNHLKTAVREAPTKEVLCVKIAEHRCYIELVETILKGVTGKNIKPSCKKLSEDMRNKNKEKQWEMMEKRWGEYFLPLPKNIRTPTQVQCSHIIPTQQRHQQTKNSKSPAMSQTYISEITTIQRPPITRYGADIHKDILDNIPVFKGKQGELTQFLSTIESYSTM